MGAVEVHHVVTGPEDAPVVVLSNSMGADLRMWDGIVDALSEHFRVVRYDTRGHGQSPEAPGPYSWLTTWWPCSTPSGSRRRTWSACRWAG